MAVKTTTIYTCDRCGRESESPDFKDTYRSGSARIQIESHEGMKGHDGAWGGRSYNKKAELCFSCAGAFREWFEAFMINPSASKQDSA